MKLPPHHRKFAKLAVLIHGRLRAPPSDTPSRELPESAWQAARRDIRRWQLAQQRGWRCAQQELQFDLRSSLEQLGEQLRRLQDELAAETGAPTVSACDIYQDLLALEDEFGQVDWKRRAGTLSVTTEPITLEGTYLGPFRIELDIRHLAGHPWYAVIAQDPQPSGVNSEVCHPHVQGDQLCEGEGVMAIRSAFRQGRLLDFFLIVRNLLHTYNASSPFVSLNEWDGVRCSECDGSMSEDESSSCGRCGATLCGECLRICCDCGESACSGCSQVCPGCTDDVCTRCSKQCSGCDQTFCPSCLQDNERCRTCHDDFPEQAENETADAEVQPL